MSVLGKENWPQITKEAVERDASEQGIGLDLEATKNKNKSHIGTKFLMDE